MKEEKNSLAWHFDPQQSLSQSRLKECSFFVLSQVPAMTLTANIVWSANQFLLKSLSPHISRFLDKKSQQSVVLGTQTYLQQKSQSLVR